MLFAVTVEPDLENVLTPPRRVRIEAPDKDAALGAATSLYREEFPVAGRLITTVNRIRSHDEQADEVTGDKT